MHAVDGIVEDNLMLVRMLLPEAKTHHVGAQRMRPRDMPS